jgi:hypothetical protein
MATVMEVCCLSQIGEAAGEVWHCLAENGAMSLAKLARSVDAPRDTVMQAVGWLAREDKVTIEETSRGRMIGLKW